MLCERRRALPGVGLVGGRAREVGCIVSVAEGCALIGLLSRTSSWNDYERDCISPFTLQPVSRASQVREKEVTQPVAQIHVTS